MRGYPALVAGRFADDQCTELAIVDDFAANQVKETDFTCTRKST
jgi:hypothetical protein